MTHNLWTFGKNYPIPLFAFTGLLLGLIFYFLGHHDISEWIWLATLILGGVPIVLQTLKGMLKGQFALDKTPYLL